MTRAAKRHLLRRQTGVTESLVRIWGEPKGAEDMLADLATALEDAR